MQLDTDDYEVIRDLMDCYNEVKRAKYRATILSTIMARLSLIFDERGEYLRPSLVIEGGELVFTLYAIEEHEEYEDRPRDVLDQEYRIDLATGCYTIQEVK